jgi:hypothetical protein
MCCQPQFKVRGAYVVHQIDEDQVPLGAPALDENLLSLQQQREARLEARTAQMDAEDREQARKELRTLEQGLQHSIPMSERTRRIFQTDRELMAGGRFTNMPVVVVGRGDYKNRWATIVGDYDSPERRDRLNAETRAGLLHHIQDDAGILTTIQIDGTNHQVQYVPIENLRHRL